MISGPDEVMVAFLVAAGLGLRPNDPPGQWEVTRAVMPADDPDNRISVTFTDFENQGLNHRTGEQHGSNVVQIRVRSRPSSAGLEKIQAIAAAVSRLALSGPVDVVTEHEETVTVVAATLVSGPANMGFEEKNQRQHYVVNYKLVLVPGE